MQPTIGALLIMRDAPEQYRARILQVFENGSVEVLFRNDRNSLHWSKKAIQYAMGRRQKDWIYDATYARVALPIGI